MDLEDTDRSMHDVFYAGGEYVEGGRGTHMTGQICVRRYGNGSNDRPPIVFIHGASQTGTHWEVTPDGRPGLAILLARHGWDCYVIDQPGIGRSRYHAADLGPLVHYTVEDLESNFTAPPPDSWPQAKLHTQWPGTGKRGDPIFDQFYASQVGHIGDYKKVEELIRPASRDLLQKIGASYFITHSQSGPLGWHVADAAPGFVKGIIALEPHGPPFEYPDYPPFNARPQIVGKVVHPYGITSIPLQYDPQLPPASTQLDYEPDPRDTLEGRARGHRQTTPQRQLKHLAGVPVVVLTAEASYHATYDHLTVQFLQDAGVAVEHVYLADRGVFGNGHMMAIEKNNGEIADLINDWLSHRDGIKADTL